MGLVGGEPGESTVRDGNHAQGRDVWPGVQVVRAEGPGIIARVADGSSRLDERREVEHVSEGDAATVAA